MTLEIGSYDRDEDLVAATRADGEPRLRVHVCPEVSVVLGRGSKPEVELSLSACAADRVPVLRRRGGGCAVVLDPGNVIVSVTLPVEGIGDNHRHFERISAWLIAGLAHLGIDSLRRDGISDLVLGDRKVGGACIYRARGLLLYSASLLVDPDVTLMERYLRHPPREPDYRRGRSHAAFVTALEGNSGGAGARREDRNSGPPGAFRRNARSRPPRQLAAELADSLDVTAL